MKVFSFVVVFSIIVIPAAGRDNTRQVADSLLSVLKRTQPGIERIDVLLQLAQFHIFKPGENQIDFDSASTYMEEAARLNKTIRSTACSGYQLLTQSYMLREKGQQEAAKKLVEQAVAMLATGNNKNYMGKACYELSNYYDYRDPQQLPEKKRLVEQSIAAFREAGNKKEQAFAMIMLGDLYVSEEPAKALKLLTEALSVYESIHYSQLQGIHITLSKVYLAQNDFGHAIQHGLKALQSARTVGDSSMQLCQINNTLGGLYSRLGQKEKAITYHKGALKTALQYNETYAIAMLIYNIAVCYKDIEKPQEALDFLATVPQKLLESASPPENVFISMAYIGPLIDTKRYKEANQYCNRLLKLIDDPAITNDMRNLMYRYIAVYFLGTGQFARARFYLDKNRELSKLFPGGERIGLDARLMYKIDSAQQNYHSAFNYLLIHKTINDSLFNVTKMRQMQQSEVEYETVKKADLIKSQDQHITLLTQTNLLQKANIKQATIIRNITIAGILVAAAIIGILYRQYRNKQKNNQIISEKNEQLHQVIHEKEWLLKEVHHRVKNNLQIMISLLESQSMYLQNDALLALEDSQRRIYAMSLIHQKLYQSDDIRILDMSLYMREFVHYLQESFDVSNRIFFRFDVSPVELSVTQAIPLALIVNEAVTNSIKYAFPNGIAGEIAVLLVEKDNEIEMQIADNGIGMPKEVVEGKSASLGLELIKGLCAEIKGRIQFDTSAGTRIIIRFKQALFNETSISTVAFD
jgi:two-component sensor histidine kinase/tetratricopeptide (TPR) repeat protein